jgi:hypothetical protein
LTLLNELDIPPLGSPVKDSLAADIKEWQLAGEGGLTHDGSETTYTAPAQMPAVTLWRLPLH